MTEIDSSNLAPAAIAPVAVATGERSRHLLPGIVMAAVAIATVLGATQIGGFGSLTAGCWLTFPLLLLILWTALYFEIGRRPFSLHLMHLIAVYIFLCVAPLYQTIYGLFPLQFFSHVDPDLVVRANALVLLWLVFYLSFYAIGSQRSSRRLEGRESRFERIVPRWRIDGSLLLSFGVMGYLAVLGLAGVATRSDAFEAVSSSASGPLTLINNQFVRAFPVVALGAGLLLVTRSFRKTALFSGPLVLICLVGNLYANNPIAAARYWTVAVIVGLAAPHVLQRRRTGTLMLASALVGLAVLPGLGAAREARNLSEVFYYVREIPPPQMYLAHSGDADAYGMLVLVLRYVDRDGLRLGQQVLGALLFWVPRSMWESKPIETGGFVAARFGFDYNNVAAPIVAECYVDFGWIGVPIFAALFGLALAHFDTAFWKRVDARPTTVRSGDTLYPFLLGMVIFITRGALISSVAYTLGFTAAALLPFFVGLGRSRSRTAPVGQPYPALAGADDLAESSGSVRPAARGG